MGLLRMGPPVELIINLQKKIQIDNFVETGTYYGKTAIWASNYFKNVLTIEYSKKMYEELIDNYKDIGNVEFIFGDSRAEMFRIVKRLKGKSIFWLDAHWSGGLTYGNNDQCALLEEINIINLYSNNEHFIFIDDARLFTSPPQPPHTVEQWPDITAVINALQSGIKKRYVVIIEDVIIAVPIFSKQTVVDYCQSVNRKTWEEYGRNLKTSKLEKGIKLIYQDVRARLGLAKKYIFKNFN
jgi:hypothetical protein